MTKIIIDNKERDRGGHPGNKNKNTGQGTGKVSHIWS